jgi:tRNA(Met) cytidine acetyltransferase
MEEPISPEALISAWARIPPRLFDARSGFDAAAFAALSGTLKAGSWLVLLTPPLTCWPTRPDADSLRWSDAPSRFRRPILSTVFVGGSARIVRRSSGVRMNH